MKNKLFKKTNPENIRIGLFINTRQINYYLSTPKSTSQFNQSGVLPHMEADQVSNFRPSAVYNVHNNRKPSFAVKRFVVVLEASKGLSKTDTAPLPSL